MQQLSGQDASFVYTETLNAPMHVGVAMIYDPGGRKVTYKGILAMLETRLHVAPMLRRRLVRVPMDVDHPYWVEDANFDLEFHVRHIALPAPGDWRQFAIQCARLMARPLDLNRPPWEMWVIEGLDDIEGLPPGSFAYLTKVHHAAIDGISGVALITAINDLAPEADVPPPTETWTPEPVPPPWELLARASVNNAMAPLKMAQNFAQSLPDLARRFAPRLPGPAAALAPGSASPTVPRTRFNGTVTAHRVVAGCKFPLRDFKQAKSAVSGATVNDTVLTVVGGAMRRYLEAKGELPGESLVTMCPVSVRNEDEKESLGNRVSAMMVSLCTTIADPLERLAAVHKSAADSKATLEGIGARNLQEMSQFMPGALVGAAARLNAEYGLANQTQPLFNFVTTNVPGPPIPLYSMGARMVDSYGLGPIQDGMGIIFAVTSYVDEITICATACRELLPDPAFLVECIRAAHAELLSALGPPPSPARPTPKATVKKAAKRTRAKP